MRINDFLNKRLSDLAADFPQISLRYCYNKRIDSFIVEITPKSEFEHNDKLDEAWILIVDDFMKEFPYEDITFVSTGSTLMENQEVYEIPNSLLINENVNIIIDDLILNTSIDNNFMSLEYLNYNETVNGFLYFDVSGTKENKFYLNNEKQNNEVEICQNSILVEDKAFKYKHEAQLKGPFLLAA
jgi:hypothetical protein